LAPVAASLTFNMVLITVSTAVNIMGITNMALDTTSTATECVGVTLMSTKGDNKVASWSLSTARTSSEMMALNVASTYNMYNTSANIHVMNFVNSFVLSYSALMCVVVLCIYFLCSWSLSDVYNCGLVLSPIMVLLYLTAVSICLFTVALTSCLVFYNIKDNLREYLSVHTGVIMAFTIALVVMLASETLLFICMYCASIQSTCTNAFGTIEGVYCPDPAYHLFINTFLLSFTGVSLSAAAVLRDQNATESNSLMILTLILGLLFIHLQIKEFSTLTFFINESLWTTCFFCLTGLHFSHILMGLLLLFLGSTNTAINYFGVLCPSCNSGIVTTVSIVYWHFVDLLWLGVIYTLYN